jgi:hypothetical protein
VENVVNVRVADIRGLLRQNQAVLNVIEATVNVVEAIHVIFTMSLPSQSYINAIELTK